MDSSYFQKKRKLEEQQEYIREQKPSKEYMPKDKEYWYEAPTVRIKPTMFEKDEKYMNYYQKQEWCNTAPVLIAIGFGIVSFFVVIIFLIMIKNFGGL